MIGSDLIPVTSVATIASFDRESALATTAERYNALVDFYKAQMREGLDYAVIPGTNKPSLLQPGADKLCTLFSLTPEIEVIEKVQDWIGQQTYGEPFFMFSVRCRIYQTGTNILIAEAIGSCNSFEKAFRYREKQRSCPSCGTLGTILKSKNKPEFYCWTTTILKS
jgi:hypothetical protein